MDRKLLKLILIFAFLVCFSTVCYAKDYSDVESRIEKGQSKKEIVKLLGESVEKKFIVKSKEFIWGPEEEFWDKIPMGTRLEVWRYEFSDGNLNLYFLNEGERLDYRAFGRKGVVY
ncbi:MAG: hypothetical protein FD156_2521 [Nitrospirae bacterium]|nr:MAG: hypothetical protein FD156_2521 [Nitrospirota bacterium]